jgi:NADH dehydrogenase
MTSGRVPGIQGMQVSGAGGRHQVVIVGGGFGGLYAAKGLAGAPVDVTVIDRRNHHVFSPLLYQVATAQLAPGEIAQPLRSLLRRADNVRVILGEAVDLDRDRRLVRLADGAEVVYDTLIVATGTRHAYFGNDGWEALAPGLKTIDDALGIRRRILVAFEAAEREPDPATRSAWLTFVIVGGGATGVELAGALGEVARDALRDQFRSIDPGDARIVLVEGMERVLPTYPERLSREAAAELRELGATIRAGTRVTGIDPEGVDLQTTSGIERLPARTVLWAAGVQVGAFGRAVAAALGAQTDRSGRISVGDDLTVPGHPEVFVIGDLAVAPWKPGRAVPGVAQGAIQGGRYVGRVVRARLAGDELPPFRFKDLGELATVGRLRAVADFRRLRFGGRLAWLLWLAIHLVWLVGLENRMLVLTRWAWSFLTRGRSNRLITGRPMPDDPIPGDEPRR